MHVAAAREVGILVTDPRGDDGVGAIGVLGAVDEPQQVALLEEPEAVHLVDDGHGAGHRGEDPAAELEAHVHGIALDVEEQIARCGRRAMAFAGRFRRTDGVRQAAAR